MNKLWGYNKFKFVNDNLIKEYSEFNQYQLGIDVTNPLGPGYGFSIDPSLSMYGTDSDSPYTDYYARVGGTIARLSAISKNALSDSDKDKLKRYKSDRFLEDLDLYTNFKILRIFHNHFNHLDVFISFDYDGDEFFGAYKNFNWIQKPELRTELYNDYRFQYIDQEYKIKLSNYIYNILDKWFKPDKGLYTILKEDCRVKDDMGTIILLKKGRTIDVKGWDVNKDGRYYITMKLDDKNVYLSGNDYYFFNYWFEKVD
jgi:hypothetical protein